MSMSKYQKKIQETINATKVYSCDEALGLLTSLPARKFIESVDLAVVLGIDPKKSDQGVRGSTLLPAGTGKSVRVAVFAQGEAAKQAQEAGAEVVGFEDLAEEIKAGKMDFDVLVATPDAMRLVGQLGQILGPRGLMPNPKLGTVTPNVAVAVKNIKGGQVSYRSEKGGIVHALIGKASFTKEQLKENLEAVVADLKKLKPATSKGVYIRKVVVSTTMGPGLVVDLASIGA